MRDPCRLMTGPKSASAWRGNCTFPKTRSTLLICIPPHPYCSIRSQNAADCFPAHGKLLCVFRCARGNSIKIRPVCAALGNAHLQKRFMPNEVIAKKLEQIATLIEELTGFLDVPFREFGGDIRRVRSAERNFQLIVDTACDINTQILLERGGKTPDTYKQSFTHLEKEEILSSELTEKLTRSVSVRNILVHEYDFDEDYEKFFNAAKETLVTYKEYVKVIYEYVRGSSQESFK